MVLKERKKLNKKTIQKLFSPRAGFESSRKILSMSNFNKIEPKHTDTAQNTENRSLWKRLLKLFKFPRFHLGSRDLEAGLPSKPTDTQNIKSYKDSNTTNNWNLVIVDGNRRKEEIFEDIKKLL